MKERRKEKRTKERKNCPATDGDNFHLRSSSEQAQTTNFPHFSQTLPLSLLCVCVRERKEREREVEREERERDNARKKEKRERGERKRVRE
jgi:hypothetical protein